MTQGLDATPEQVKSITAIVEQSMQQSGGPGVDRNARQKARAAMRAQVAALLTPEQRIKFDAMQPSAGRGRGGDGGKSGGVWVLDAKGEPQRRFVRTSTGDEEFAALRGGQLKAGDKVITGEVVPDEDAAK